MSTLLIKNISQLVTCDDNDRVLNNVDVLCKDGFIEQIGAGLDAAADRIIDGSHMLCYPGLVNTHHHLYQVFSRNLAKVQNMELFDWLKTLYEIWKNLDSEVIRLSSLTGMGELMKHGCTTCSIWRTLTLSRAPTSCPSLPSMWSLWVSTAASRPLWTR